MPPTPNLPEVKRLAPVYDRWCSPTQPYVQCSLFLGAQLPDIGLASWAAASWGGSKHPLLKECSLRFSLLSLFTQVFPLLLKSPYQEQKALFGLWQGVNARPWTTHNGWHVDKAPPKMVEPRNSSSWIPSSGQAPSLPGLPSNSCAWGGKAISSLLFPFQDERKEWGTSARQGHFSF
jgi:hypothetical protein